MTLILLNEVLKDANVVSALRLVTYGTCRCRISAQNWVHVCLGKVLRILLAPRCVVREVSTKLSVRLIVIFRILSLLLLLLHVDHLHVLLS